MLHLKQVQYRESIHSPAHTELREAFIRQRLKLGLTQRDLAKKLNITHSLIGKIETGDRRLDVVEFIEYCQILEIDPPKLMATIAQYIINK